MKKRILHISTVLAVLLMLMTPLSAFAESSNRNEVRAGLAQGGWSVVYGDLINEWDYVQFIAAVAGAVSCECPAPIADYFDAQFNAQIEKIQRTAPEIAYDALIDLLIRAFNSDGAVLQQGNLEISAGLATYKRWESVAYDEPRTYECRWPLPFGGWTKGVCTTTERVVREVPLPNNFQPYFRFRVTGGNPAVASSGGVGFNIANNSNDVLWAAIGYKRNGEWVAEGWWKLDPGETEQILSGTLQNRYYYFYAESANDNEWAGNHYFWIHPHNAFGPVADSLDSSTAATYGYARRGFREVDIGDYTSYTVNLHN